MSILNPYVTMGGSNDAISYPLATDVGYDYNEDVDDAIAFAGEALEAAEKLQGMVLTQDKADALGKKLLNVAVETYINRFEIPRIALEADVPALPYNGGGSSSNPNPSTTIVEDDEDNEAQTSRLKKVILYLYAIVERVFKAVIDLWSTQKITARKIMPLTKLYIGEADSLSASIASQLSIKDHSIMSALHVNGKAPENPQTLFAELSQVFEKQHEFNTVPELVALLNATKAQDVDRTVREAQTLRKKLEDGFKASMEETSPDSLYLFEEKKSEVTDYYASKPMFGQTYILGTIGKGVTNTGTFRYSCRMRRDGNVTLRVNYFPVLTPDEIRQISRTALKVCENIIRFSRDEELLQKVLREAAFVRTKSADKSAVVALRNISAVGQNSYIVHLRYLTRTMKSLMHWCAASIKRYEGVTNG